MYVQRVYGRRTDVYSATEGKKSQFYHTTTPIIFRKNNTARERRGRDRERRNSRGICFIRKENKLWVTQIAVLFHFSSFLGDCARNKNSSGNRVRVFFCLLCFVLFCYSSLPRKHTEQQSWDVGPKESRHRHRYHHRR